MASTDDNSLHVLETVTYATPAYADRAEAGRVLAEWISPTRDPSALVLALPRGGIPVARPLADALGCPLRPALVRKLAIPTSPEMGFGAIAADGTLTLNDEVVRSFGIGRPTIDRVADETRQEVLRRAKVYPGGWPVPQMEGSEVWVVDDGLATGYTALAAAKMARAAGVARLVLVVPCAPLSAVRRLAPHVNALWCAIIQQGVSFAVASFYRDFHDLADSEVVRLLDAV